MRECLSVVDECYRFICNRSILHEMVLNKCQRLYHYTFFVQLLSVSKMSILVTWKKTISRIRIVSSEKFVLVSRKLSAEGVYSSLQ